MRTIEATLRVGMVVSVAAAASAYSPIAAAATTWPACPTNHVCIKVNTTAWEDPAKCSLIDAVIVVEFSMNYNGCVFQGGVDTVLLPQITQPTTFDISQGGLPLDGVTIVGNGVTNTILTFSPGEATVAVGVEGSNSGLTGLALQGKNMTPGSPVRGIQTNGTIVTLDHVLVTGFNNSGINSDNVGQVDLMFSTVDGNSSAVRGGGILITNDGIVNLINSTISNNTAPSGGGIDVVRGELDVAQSTIALNKATAGNGGGVESLDPAPDPGTAIIKGWHNTVAFNTATGVGGGVHATGSTNWNASIFAFNTGTNGRKDIGDYVGKIRSDPNSCLQDGLNKNVISTLSNPQPTGWNLVNTGLAPDGKTHCTSSSGIGDFVADPLFSSGALASNGGPTKTFALKKNTNGKGGSPAINAGVKPANTSLWFDRSFLTDQRGPGFPAPLGSLYDIGSFEAQ